MLENSVEHEVEISDDLLDTRIWLRLLICTTHIESRLRRLLRAEYGMTLPRFDYLAQLNRYPDGLQMKFLSKYLMVSDGNVTSLTNGLLKNGYVEKVTNLEDRRSSTIRLSRKGKKEFDVMAASHKAWLADIFEGLPNDFKQVLHGNIQRLEDSLAVVKLGTWSGSNGTLLTDKRGDVNE